MNAIHPATPGSSTFARQQLPADLVLGRLLHERGRVKGDPFKDVPKEDLFLAAYDGLPPHLHLLDIKHGRVVRFGGRFAFMTLIFGASSGYFAFDEHRLDESGDPVCLGGLVHSCGRDISIGDPIWTTESNDGSHRFSEVFTRHGAIPKHELQFTSGLELSMEYSMLEHGEGAAVIQSLGARSSIAYDFQRQRIVTISDPDSPDGKLVRRFSEHTAFTRVTAQPKGSYEVRCSGTHDYYPFCVYDRAVFNLRDYAKKTPVTYA